MDTTKTTKGSILIAHIADLHLRDTQYATAQRSADFFEAALRAVRAAKENGADCICCCGDNFDVARPSARVISQLTRLDVELKTLGLPMFTITGNHDYSNPTWLATLFPGRGETGIIPTDGVSHMFKGFQITGIPAYNAKLYRAKAAEIELAVREADVVLYHGFVTGIVPVYVGSHDCLTVDELILSSKTKAVLLGDIHQTGTVTRQGPSGRGVLIGYPGSLEMCSKSESTEKQLPLVRVDDAGAVIEKTVQLTIRKFISRVVNTPDELDALMVDVQAASASNPVVLVEFDRALPQTVSRLHAALDAQRCVLRCYPLPAERGAVARATDDADAEESLGIDHFVGRRFAETPELLEFAMALLYRGDTDANNITSDFVQRRLDAIVVREN